MKSGHNSFTRRLIDLSFRNVLRHRRRNLLIGLTLSLCTLLGLTSLVFSHSVKVQMIQNIVTFLTGHVSIRKAVEGETAASEQAQVLEPVLDREHLVPVSGDWLRTLQSSHPGISSVTTRLRFQATVNSGFSSMGVIVSGIDPFEKSPLTANLKAEKGLSGLDKPEIMISTTISETLGIEQGATLTLLCQTVDGSLNALDVEVVGVYKKTVPWVERVAYVPLGTAQELVQAHGQVSEILCYVDDPSQSGNVARSWQTEPMIRQKGLAVRTFQEGGSIFVNFATGYGLMLALANIVILLMVSFGIANSMMFAVQERKREIGTMRAMGLRSMHITALFILEGIWLGAIAASLGAVIGSGVFLALRGTGLNLGDVAAWILGGSSLHLILKPFDIVIMIGVMVAVTSLTSLYAGWRTARQLPVDLLRAR
ncbi:MAG: FtsX-like permease family protein [bacterium]